MTAKEYYNSTRMVETRHWTLEMTLAFAEEYHKSEMVDKKYTEEDIRKAIEKAIYLKGGFDKEGFSFYKDDNEIKEDIIHSLNKQD